MTDLIDRAALREQLAHPQGTAEFFAAVVALRVLLDAAPTVSCAECEHAEYGKGAEWCLQHELAIPSDDYGCSDFERRQT